MPTEAFISNLKRYQVLTADSIMLLCELCTQEPVPKNMILLDYGTIPRYYYFVESGLFAYYYLAADGDEIIKRFFAAHSFMASVSAALGKAPGQFQIRALEDSLVFRIPVAQFQQLVLEHHDIALFYIRYLETHWVIAKELQEVTLKADNATVRYLDFLDTHAAIVPRLRQHHIAAFLGITPTQLSRIKQTNGISTNVNV